MNDFVGAVKFWKTKWPTINKAVPANFSPYAFAKKKIYFYDIKTTTIK